MDLRFILGISDNTDRTIRGAVAGINASNLLSTIDGTYQDIPGYEDPSVLFKTTVREAEFDTLDEAYSYDNIQWEFASDYIREKVFDNNKNNAFVKQFLVASKGVTEVAVLRADFL
jgi:hypothetical protein